MCACFGEDYKSGRSLLMQRLGVSIYCSTDCPMKSLESEIALVFGGVSCVCLSTGGSHTLFWSSHPYLEISSMKLYPSWIFQAVGGFSLVNFDFFCKKNDIISWCFEVKVTRIKFLFQTKRFCDSLWSSRETFWRMFYRFLQTAKFETKVILGLGCVFDVLFLQ